MSVSSEVQRTLVKSPPELWAELSDPASLANHLGELGEIRIVRTVPETTVEWEAPDLTGSVQIKPSAWGTKVTLSVTQELRAPEPQTQSEQLEAKPQMESGQGPAVSRAIQSTQSIQSTPDPATRLEAGRPIATREGGSPEVPASQHGVHPESAGRLHRDPSPGADAGSEGSLQGDSRPRPDPDTADPVQGGLQPAPDPAAESAMQGGRQPTADPELESAKSEAQLQRGIPTTAGDPPEPVLTRRRGPFARALRRLRGFQRFKTPSAPSEPAQFAGDVDVSEPTAASPEEPTPERVVAESVDNQPGKDQPGGEQGEPETYKTPADEPPGATSQTPASGLRSEASEDAIADVQAVQTVSASPAADEQSDASDNAMGGAQAAQALGASPEQSAVESLASERATAVLISVLDRLGAAHHRPFSRG